MDRPDPNFFLVQNSCSYVLNSHSNRWNFHFCWLNLLNSIFFYWWNSDFSRFSSHIGTGERNPFPQPPISARSHSPRRTSPCHPSSSSAKRSEGRRDPSSGRTRPRRPTYGEPSVRKISRMGRHGRIIELNLGESRIHIYTFYSFVISSVFPKVLKMFETLPALWAPVKVSHPSSHRNISLFLMGQFGLIVEVHDFLFSKLGHR